jgi:hypothetical protein
MSPRGTLRTAVVLEEGSGATLLVSFDDLPKVLERIDRCLEPVLEHARERRARNA